MLQCPRWSNVARSSPLTLNKPPRGRQRPDVAGSRGRHGNVLGAPSVSEMRSDGQARTGSLLLQAQVPFWPTCHGTHSSRARCLRRCASSEVSPSSSAAADIGASSPEAPAVPRRTTIITRRQTARKSSPPPSALPSRRRRSDRTKSGPLRAIHADPRPLCAHLHSRTMEH